MYLGRRLRFLLVLFFPFLELEIADLELKKWKEKYEQKQKEDLRKKQQLIEERNREREALRHQRELAEQARLKDQDAARKAFFQAQNEAALNK